MYYVWYLLEFHRNEHGRIRFNDDDDDDELVKDLCTDLSRRILSRARGRTPVEPK